MRAVERSVLLETLANRLPPDAVRFSSKVEKIERNESGETMLELVDGTRLLGQVVFSVYYLISHLTQYKALFWPYDFEFWQRFIPAPCLGPENTIFQCSSFCKTCSLNPIAIFSNYFLSN